MSTLFETNELGSKLKLMTDLLCKVSDAEALITNDSEKSYFCSIEDVVAALLICGEAEQSANCAETKRGFEQTTEDFPNMNCSVQSDSLHKGLIPRDTFHFQDESIDFPLLLHDYTKEAAGVPRSIPLDIQQKESLTYAALFRGLIISAAFSRKPFLCGASSFEVPRLLPGWDLPLALSLWEEGEPSFSEPGVVKNSMPLVFVSQRRSDKCNFLFTLRGTASTVEWILDFNYGQAPFPSSMGHRVLTQSGFLNILSSIANPVDLFLTSQSAANSCTCQNTKIFIAGKLDA